MYFESGNNNIFNFRYADHDESNIFRLSLSDGSVKPLAKGRMQTIDQGEGIIYFSASTPGEAVLFQMDLDGSNQAELHMGKMSWNWINIIDDALYLLDWNPDGSSQLFTLE